MLLNLSLYSEGEDRVRVFCSHRKHLLSLWVWLFLDAG
jgi:hypothetical protein